MNAVSLEIRESLDQLESYWDDSVGNPIIMKLNPKNHVANIEQETLQRLIS